MLKIVYKAFARHEYKVILNSCANACKLKLDTLERKYHGTL
nr:MAG TPA: hypothetical protein [Caudoviricetes sp.]